jgi:hypothetical protein
MQIIEQSTSITIRIGPFVDEDDGKTAETGLTITQADIRLSKNGGAFAQSNDSGGATHDESGWYYLTLDATDTGTLGRLIVAIHESGALPVWREFMVLPASIYDSLVAGTDYLQVDVRELLAAVGNKIADHIWRRNMATCRASSDGDGTGRFPLQALSFIRNKRLESGGTLTVMEEDDSTSDWTATLTTDSGADPITGVDPG